MGKKKSKGKKGASAASSAPRRSSPSSTAKASANGSALLQRFPETDDASEATPHAPPPKLPPPPPESRVPIKADPPTGSTEKRLFRRIPFFRKIHFKFESMDEFKSEFANDISIGGMFIKTDAPEPVGSVVFLKFDLKDGSKILSGYGKVVRVNPTGQPDFDPGMGVEFLKFDEDSLVRIKQLVTERFGDR